MIKIFLDDLREPPDDSWAVARCIVEFQVLVEENFGNIDEISLDHDLGGVNEQENNGYRAICWLEKKVCMDGMPKPNNIYIHSANPSVHGKMRFAANKILNH